MKTPQEWRSKRLGDLLDKIGSGVTPKGGKESYLPVGIPLIRSQNVLWGKLSLEDVAYIDPAQHRKMSGSYVRPHDVLLNITGASIGRACVVPENLGEANVSQHVCILRPKGALSAKFLLMHLASGYGQRQIDLFQAGGNRQGLNYDQIRTFEISLPPLPEQQKIADILGTWDEALEKLDALIAAKARRKQALMQQLLTGKLRLSGYKGNLWNAVRMAGVLQRVFRPVGVARTDLLALVSIRRRLGGLFRRPDVLASEYKTQDLHAIKGGDFLISKRQVVHGAWAIVEPAFDGALVSKEYAIFVNYAPEKLDMRFFAWLAQMPRMLRLARVASTGVHIEKLIFDPDVFLREQIRIPSDIKEQAAIAAVLDTADAELRLLRQQRIALGQQKRGLMQQLLTGRKRVSI
jgi:type I restriction enzyme S subunit